MGDLVNDNDEEKTREQLENELSELRSQNAALKKVQKTLAVTEAKYQELVQNANSIILRMDPDGKVLFFNEFAQKFFGYTEKEILGCSVIGTIVPETNFSDHDLDSMIRNIGKNPEKYINNENENMRRNGERTWVAWTNRAICDELGNVTEILCIGNDITEHKRLESLLSESEERYRRLFETAKDGIVLLEKSNGHITHVNPAAEMMFGYSSKECSGKRLQDIGVMFDMGDFQTIIQELNKNGIINYTDVPVKTKSGQHIETDIYLVDRARLAQCNIRDVTERNRAEMLLKEEKTFVENALNVMKEIIFIFDVENRFIRWNKMFCLVSGYSDEEIVSMKLTDFCRNKDIDSLTETIRKVLEKGIASTEILFVTKDGREIPHEITASLFRDHQGDTIGIIGVGLDITERNILEGQLRHSQKMEGIGQLAGGIAHDFNNILSAIVGYGDMMHMKMKKDDPLRVNVEQILAAADRATNLTHSLLTFSRKQVINPKPVDMNEVVQRVEKLLERIIGEDIELKMSLAENALIVNADAGQIEQVMMNLAANARDAMPSGGHFTIETNLITLDDLFIRLHGYGVPGTYAVVTVTDTGTGINEAVQNNIFDPFFTTKEVGKGTGLGLSIVYGIIKQHNGYINVYSEPGKGSTFRIYVPLIKSRPEKTDFHAAKSLEQLPRGTETILVAEDNEAIRWLFKSIFEEYGYTIILAADGEDAIKKFGEHKDKIRMAILDMIMPRKSGKEVYKEIKKMRPDIKVIFVSGYTADKIHLDGILEEGLELIQKPVTPSDLLKKVRVNLDS